MSALSCSSMVDSSNWIKFWIEYTDFGMAPSMVSFLSSATKKTTLSFTFTVTLSELILSTKALKFFLKRSWCLVHSKKGIIKLSQGLKIRLYFPKNSTVLTVFGTTILTENMMSITERIIATIICPVMTQITNITTTKKGINIPNIV